MEHQDQMVAAIRDSTAEVFATMLGLEVTPQESYVEVNQVGPSGGVVALIGLAGAWIGTGALHCNAECACLIASAMMQQTYEVIGDEVLDAISELTNMIIGNVKTSLEDALGVLGLSIPTVIYGRNFMTRSVQKADWIVAPFRCNGFTIQIKMCVARVDEPQPVRHGFSQSLLLNG
ncbi:MAG: chemotaxis protein CheX [Bryobacteraceae bacterium]|nr:chemotaxis protein CheX [Bryobacteraceae bacterium]